MRPARAGAARRPQPSLTAGAGPGDSPEVRDFGELWRAADKVVYSGTLDAVSTPRTTLERSFDPATVVALKDAVGRVEPLE